MGFVWGAVGLFSSSNFFWSVFLVRRICVVGNVGGGKTRLARRLADKLGLPLTHVDSIQFLPGLKMRPYKESIDILREIQKQESWIIDGYGPLDILVERFELAERIVFIDFPMWRHRWWFLKRQALVLFSPREELPAGCFEFSWQHTLRVWKGIGSEHRQMRPELLRIFSREMIKDKVIFVRTLKEWNSISKKGL